MIYEQNPAIKTEFIDTKNKRLYRLELIISIIIINLKFTINEITIININKIINRIAYIRQIKNY